MPVRERTTRNRTIRGNGCLYTIIFTGIIGLCSMFTRTISPSSEATLFPVAPQSTLQSVTKTLLPSTLPVGNSALPACIRDKNPQYGKVTRVVDGDTIHVIIGGQDYPVRYIGINTPESTTAHEPFGEEASRKNTELVDGKQVTLYRDVSETDRYNRLLRYVFVDGIFINNELVKQGFAEAKKYPPDIACAILFGNTQADAQSKKLGLWALAIFPTQPAIHAPSSSSGLIILSVNKQSEFAIIQNSGSIAIDISGWRLVSEKGNQACTLSGIIQPGATLQVNAQTGPGFSCHFSKPIWSNTGSDPAVLYNPQGQEVDRY